MEFEIKARINKNNGQINLSIPKKKFKICNAVLPPKFFVRLGR